MISAAVRRERQLERTRRAIARGMPAATHIELFPRRGCAGTKDAPSASLPPRRLYQSGPLVEPELDARTRREVAADSAETGICLRCGRSHAPENRRRLIRPMRDMLPSEVAAAWPCFYPRYAPGSASEGLLARDLRAVRRGGRR